MYSSTTENVIHFISIACGEFGAAVGLGSESPPPPNTAAPKLRHPQPNTLRFAGEIRGKCDSVLASLPCHDDDDDKRAN